MRKLKTEVWPYQVRTKLLSLAVDEWCTENLGYRFREWYSYYTTHDERIFAFKDEATLLVFKLRWSYNGN